MRNKCPWFNADEKPVRVGVYSVKVTPRGRPFFRHWNGETWGAVCFTAANAELHRDSHLGLYGLLPWRGVLKS